MVVSRPLLALTLPPLSTLPTCVTACCALSSLPVTTMSLPDCTLTASPLTPTTVLTLL